jgi:hypothetical protein
MPCPREIAILVQDQHNLEFLGDHDHLAQEGVEELDAVSHLGELAGHFLGYALKKAVSRPLDGVLGRTCDPFAGLPGQAKRITGRFLDRTPLDDAQADRAVLADHPAGVVVSSSGGNPHDIKVELAAEIGRHAGYGVDRAVNDR